MDLRTKTHPRIPTCDQNGRNNGYLVPLYNVQEHFFEPGREPQQVYLTVVAPGGTKGPHLHYVRTGYFTCIKGNVRIIVKLGNSYREYLSGEAHQYLSVEIPAGVPAMVQNIGKDEAFVLNMPNPAWTPDMNDEHTADFSDLPAGFGAQSATANGTRSQGTAPQCVDGAHPLNQRGNVEESHSTECHPHRPGEES